jgi:hypothetical protein
LKIVGGGSEKIVSKLDNIVGGSEKIVGRSDNIVGGSEKIVGRSENIVGDSEKIVGRSENIVGGSKKNLHSVAWPCHIRRTFIHGRGIVSLQNNQPCLKRNSQISVNDYS